MQNLFVQKRSSKANKFFLVLVRSDNCDDDDIRNQAQSALWRTNQLEYAFFVSSARKYTLLVHRELGLLVRSFVRWLDKSGAHPNPVGQSSQSVSHSQATINNHSGEYK